MTRANRTATSAPIRLSFLWGIANLVETDDRRRFPTQYGNSTAGAAAGLPQNARRLHADELNYCSLREAAQIILSSSLHEPVGSYLNQSAKLSPQPLTWTVTPPVPVFSG